MFKYIKYVSIQRIGYVFFIGVFCLLNIGCDRPSVTTVSGTDEQIKFVDDLNREYERQLKSAAQHLDWSERQLRRIDQLLELEEAQNVRFDNLLSRWESITTEMEKRVGINNGD